MNAQDDGVTSSWGGRQRFTDYGGDAYAEMIESLRQFLDRVAAARPDHDTVTELTRSLQGWSETLTPMAVDSRNQVFAHRTDIPGRGQTLVPVFEPTALDDDEVVGRARFGRFYLGGNAAAHGGAISLLFDEVLGGLANRGRRGPCRTAYLKVDYRSVVPIETNLRVSARVVHEAGRKRFLVGELRDGDRVCAEADGLFLKLKPGQP